MLKSLNVFLKRKEYFKFLTSLQIFKQKITFRPQ